MRKSLILLAAAVPLVALAAAGLSATAGSTDAPAATTPLPGVLDLDRIPVKPVTGPQSVHGIAGDDESEADDDPIWLRQARGAVQSVFDDDEHDGARESDD
jgi:hypothetical protein